MQREARAKPWVRLKYFTFQPAIFPRLLGEASPDARPGDLVNVYDKGGQPLGIGPHVDHDLGSLEGFFRDQRENRRLIAKFAKATDGEKWAVVVLDPPKLRAGGARCPGALGPCAAQPRQTRWGQRVPPGRRRLRRRP